MGTDLLVLIISLSGFGAGMVLAHTIFENVATTSSFSFKHLCVIGVTCLIEFTSEAAWIFTFIC